MTDRRAGIAIGLVLGIVAVVLFVFVFSDETVDAPSVDEAGTEQSQPNPGGEDGDGDGSAGQSSSGGAGGNGTGRGSEEGDRPPEPQIPTIEVVDGEPVGGVQTFETQRGQRIAFRVRSDVADDVHVHGYDLFEDVTAGGTTRFSFVADIDGIFEIELEDRHVQIAELRVNP